MAAAASGVSPNLKQLQQAMKKLAPPLQPKGHKGQHGRVGVMGGSKAYTGAPYFSAMTALAMGTDLSTVFCSVEAGVAIKTYSPDLMVRPCLFPKHLAADALAQLGDGSGMHVTQKGKEDAAVRAMVSEVSQWSDRLDSMVVGPGLGKDELMVRTVGAWLEHAASRDEPAPVVIDGDGIHVLLEHPQLVKTRLVDHLVLTPNAAEFRRLWEKFVDKNPPPFDLDTDVQWLTDNPDGGEISISHSLAQDTAKLASHLGHATVVRKGAVDVISDGRRAAIVSAEGSPRRVGGQGDLLAGAIGTFVTWARLAKQQRQQEKKDGKGGGEGGDAAADQPPLPELMFAAWSAAHFCRSLARKSFAGHGRSMLASHLLLTLPEVLHEWYPIKGVNIPHKL